MVLVEFLAVPLRKPSDGIISHVQFSPFVVFPDNKVVMFVFVPFVTETEPLMFATPFLYHVQYAVKVEFSASVRIALHVRLSSV